MAIRARIIRIGNSRGLRLPKHLLEQTALGDVVELEARRGEIAIRSAPSAGQAGMNSSGRWPNTEMTACLMIRARPEWDETEWQW